MGPHTCASRNACVYQIPLLLGKQSMELKDEIIINAPMARVYEALNDPDILRECIP
jgi:hypothetical protein